MTCRGTPASAWGCWTALGAANGLRGLQPVTVRADRVMLERAVDNLLGNATK